MCTSARTIQARVGRCGIAFEAIVQARDPQIDRDTRSLTVQASVPNPRASSHPGHVGAASSRDRLGEGSRRRATRSPGSSGGKLHSVGRR